MSLEDILLSKLSPSQKDDTLWFDAYEVSKIAEVLETQSRMVVARSCGKGANEELINGYRLPVLQDEKVLELCCSTECIEHLKVVKIVLKKEKVFIYFHREYLEDLLSEKKRRLPILCRVFYPLHKNTDIKNICLHWLQYAGGSWKFTQETKLLTYNILTVHGWELTDGRWCKRDIYIV